MSFESCSKKRALEDNVDHQAKPGIDDFCRKKFKPIAPKPTLKKDQHQAVVLATLPVKSSYLEDNDSCKLKYGGAADPGKQMILMSPQHMHVMSNLPVMLHAPTLVAMNSCNPMSVLANYSFVIPVGCGHCNCGKSTQPVVCKSPPKNFCSHCHDEPCCKKDIEIAACKSCDCSSEGNCCKKSMDENTQHPYSRKTPQVPILPLNASLPSNLKDILKLRPEKYKYSMLLNSPGTYTQIAEKTARQTNSIQLMNCSVASDNQFNPVTTSSGYSSTTHCTPFSATVSSCSSTGPTVHSRTQSNSLELNSSRTKLSRSLVLPSITPSSKSAPVPTYTPVVSSASNCSNFTKGPVHPPPQSSNSSAIEESTATAQRVHSVNKNSHNEAEKRTLNSLDSLNPDEISSCNDSPYIPFDTNTSVVPTNHSSNSFLSSTASSLVSISHSISSAGPINTHRSSVPSGATVPTEYRPLSKEAETQAQKRKKVSPSVEFLSVSSRTVPSMPAQRPGAHIDHQKNVNAPLLQPSMNVTTGTVQSSVTTLTNTMHNINTRMAVPSPRSKDNNINVQTSQRLHHRDSQPVHNTRRAFDVTPVSHQRSSMMPKEQVAPEKTSERSRIGSIPSQPPQIPNSSAQQISRMPSTVNRITTSRGHIPFHNSIVNTSSNLVSNVTGRTDSVCERYMAATVASSTIPSQTRMTDRLSIGVAGMSSAGFQTRPHTTEHSTASKQSYSSAILNSSKNGTDKNRHRSEDTNAINTSCLPVSSNVVKNLANRPKQASKTQSLNHQNISCQRSNNLQTDRRPREFLREPQRETQEKDLSSSTPRREWPCMIPQVHGSGMATSFPRGDPVNPLQNNSLSTPSSWTDFTRHNNVNQARPVPTSNDTCRQTEQQSSNITSQSPTNPDATLPRTVQSDPIIQTVPLISNVPASSRLPPNSAITRKPRQRCCLPRQESSTLSSETTSSSLPSPIEHTQHTRASCSALGSHKTPTRGSEGRLPNIFPPGMDKRLHHSHAMHAHSQVTEQCQPAGSDHPVSDLPFTHQNHNPVPRPMLYNFPHMLNSQSDIQHRFPIPGGLGRHPLTSHHMNHLQECNLSTPPHSTPHGSLHQPGSRHLLVPPPPPFSSMHRSMFMSPSPHPPDVNLMSPRSFPSTHMHDNLLYSPASISRLPTTPGFPDRLHTSYPVHYLPEDRMDSCCSGGLRTSHSPTTNNFSAPWLLSSPSRTPAPPFHPSFPRHNSLSNLTSSQDFYGFGSMNNITAPYHMPGCLSEMNIQRHTEPLHIQTDTQAERDATGSSQLSPIVTPPPAAETLTRPPLRNTSSEPALILPAMNTASEGLNNHPVRRNIMENPGNPLLARNTLRENQVSRPSIRSTSSETSSQHPPARRTSSEQCMGQTPIATSILNQHRDKNSGKNNHPIIHNSSVPMTAATPGSVSSRRSSSVQNPSVQQQPNVSLSQPASQTTSISDTSSQMMPPSPATQRLNNKYLPIDETNSNPSTSQVPLVAPSPTNSLSEQPVKFNGVTLQCSRQILCESGRTVLCCWNCDFHTAEPKKMHRHQRREEKVMRCQLCSFTGNSRCKVDQHFKENHLDKDDPFTSAVS